MKKCGKDCVKEKCQPENKYKNFSDAELYTLKIQAVESSFEITMSGHYEEDIIKIHDELMNGLVNELKRRRKAGAIHGRV